MTTAEIVKTSKITRFVCYREGHLHYKTDNGFYFPVPLEDVGKASMLAEEKTVYFMRWIRKQVDARGKPETFDCPDMSPITQIANNVVEGKEWPLPPNVNFIAMITPAAFPAPLSPEFVPYPKTPRLNRECIISEKLDGTSCQVFIDEAGNIRAGSRNRWITPGKQTDNYGFARWVEDNKSELLKLGPGRHFGEWWGNGIARGYGLKEKRFSLFNAGRWIPNFTQDGDGNQTLAPGVWEDVKGTKSFGPACCHVVPVFWRGVFDNFDVRMALADLRERGSWAVPGYRNPEGIIIYHTAAKQCFKVLLENDNEPKSAVEPAVPFYGEGY